MAVRKPGKKGALKNVTRAMPKKSASKRTSAKATLKKKVAVAPLKEPTRDPLTTATAAYREAGKKLAAARKAFDRAVALEARAAEKLRVVNEKIAKKSQPKAPKSSTQETRTVGKETTEVAQCDPGDTLND